MNILEQCILKDEPDTQAIKVEELGLIIAEHYKPDSAREISEERKTTQDAILAIENFETYSKDGVEFPAEEREVLSLAGLMQFGIDDNEQYVFFSKQNEGIPI